MKSKKSIIYQADTQSRDDEIYKIFPSLVESQIRSSYTYKKEGINKKVEPKNIKIGSIAYCAIDLHKSPYVINVAITP